MLAAHAMAEYDAGLFMRCREYDFMIYIAADCRMMAATHILRRMAYAHGDISAVTRATTSGIIYFTSALHLKFLQDIIERL